MKKKTHGRCADIMIIDLMAGEKYFYHFFKEEQKSKTKIVCTKGVYRGVCASHICTYTNRQAM